VAGSYTIPTTVSNIGFIAFSGARNLTSVMIPNSVTTIGNSAFNGCTSLTTVTIPSSVTNIPFGAFAQCYSLRSVYFLGNAPAVNSFAFLSDSALVYYLPGTTGWGSSFGGRPTVLWTPSITPGDRSFGIKSNAFGFAINWAAGMEVVVEAATNLTSDSWVPLQTNTLTTNSAPFTDLQWTNYRGRYYRLRSP
jgi:hypothetical protein